MYIEHDLSKHTQNDFEKKLYPKIKKILNVFFEKYEEDIDLKINGLNFKIGHVSKILDEKEEEIRQKNITKLNILLNNFEDKSLSTMMKKIKLKNLIKIPQNNYLSITDDHGLGYVYYNDNDNDTTNIYKVYPDFFPSENPIENLTLTEFISLINNEARENRHLADSSFSTYPHQPSINYLIENVILNNEKYTSLESLLSFKEKALDSNLLETKSLYHINNVNDAINKLNEISLYLNKEILVQNDFVIDTYNNNLKDFKVALSSNMKLKFNQIYNIMDEYFKDVREDYADLDNHISLITLNKMQNNRAIFMESQNRDILAIEMDNGEINFYQMANNEANEDNFSFDYNYHKLINQKIIMNISNKIKNLHDPIDCENPKYLSLEFFKEKFDGSQNIEASYSTSLDYVFKNILDENMAYGLTTQCQRFLCYYKKIDFDKHEEYDGDSLEAIINKGMNMYSSNYSTRKKALFNELFCSYDTEFTKYRIERGEGTSVPFKYPKIEDNDDDFKCSWYSFSKTALAGNIPLTINNDILEGIKEIFIHVKKYYNENPNEIESQETYINVISKIEKNIEDIESYKRSKKIQNKIKLN